MSIEFPHLTDKEVLAHQIFKYFPPEDPDFDMKEWEEQDCSCRKCGSVMGLRDGAEWGDEPQLLICTDCALAILEDILIRVRRVAAKPTTGETSPG
jgi:hypothetical protein